MYKAAQRVVAKLRFAAIGLEGKERNRFVFVIRRCCARGLWVLRSFARNLRNARAVLR